MSLREIIIDKLRDWWVNDQSDENYDAKVLAEVKKIEEVQAKVHESKNGDFVKKANVNEKEAAEVAKGKKKTKNSKTINKE